MTPDNMPPNAGSNLIEMLIDAARASGDELRSRISNVRFAPLCDAVARNNECILFEFDGNTYFGELKGRNRTLYIDSRNPDADANRAIAARVLLDNDATNLNAQKWN